MKRLTLFFFTCLIGLNIASILVIRSQGKVIRSQEKRLAALEQVADEYTRTREAVKFLLSTPPRNQPEQSHFTAKDLEGLSHEQKMRLLNGQVLASISGLATNSKP